MSPGTRGCHSVTDGSNDDETGVMTVFFGPSMSLTLMKSLETIQSEQQARRLRRLLGN